MTLLSGVDTWQKITPFLAAHHGCVDRDELDRAGVTRHQLARWVAQSRLERSAPRVWRVVGSPDMWEQRLTIALLALGSAAAVSHWAAAQLHGLDRAPRDPVEFLVPEGHHHVAIDYTAHRSSSIHPTDVLTVNGFRTTSATRTILDIANTPVDRARLAALMDSAVHLHLTAPEAIRRRLETLRGPGRAGVRLVDELLLDAGGHTMLERAFLRLMRLEGLPRPTPQVVFHRDGERLARVDFVFREWSIVVEVTGRQGHSSPSERARDAQRRNELQDVGVRVIEYTYEHVTRRGTWVRRQMRDRLAAAGWVA